MNFDWKYCWHLATLFMCRLVLCLTFKSICVGEIDKPMCAQHGLNTLMGFLQLLSLYSQYKAPSQGVYKLMHSENIHSMHTLDLVLVACPEQWWLRTGGLMAAKKESSHSPTRAAPPSSCGSSDWLSTLSTSTIFHNKPDLLPLWLAFTLSHVSQCTSHTLVSPF